MPRDRLFDLAMERALTYALRLGALAGAREPDELRRALEVWYLKTRFAYRIPLEEIVTALLSYPGPGHEWRGGEAGGWRRREG